MNLNATNMIGPSILIFVGALISAIGACWASVEQNSFKEEIRSKNEEIARLNREVANSVTGGDGFAYLVIGNIHPSKRVGFVTVVSRSEHPLYDVSARIVNLDSLKNASDTERDTISIDAHQESVKIGNLAPELAAQVTSWKLPSGEVHRYNVFFSARNGLWTELLRIRKIDGEWEQAYKVVRNNEGEEKVLETKIPDGWPRNSDGKVEW